MNSSIQSLLSVLTATVLLTVSAPSSFAATNDHIVPLGEVERQIRRTAEQRVKDTADIERVLSYPAAAKELARYNVKADQVHQAIATLSDSELSRLADRARASEEDVQGGLIVGILALIGLIVVIIVVVSIVAEARPPAPGAGSELSGDGRIERWPATAQVAAVHGC